MLIALSQIILVTMYSVNSHHCMSTGQRGNVWHKYDFGHQSIYFLSGYIRWAYMSFYFIFMANVRERTTFWLQKASFWYTAYNNCSTQSLGVTIPNTLLISFRAFDNTALEVFIFVDFSTKTRGTDYALTQSLLSQYHMALSYRLARRWNGAFLHI